MTVKPKRGGRLVASLLSLGAALGCTSHAGVKLEGALDYLPGGESVLVKADEAISLYDIGKRRALWERRPASPGRPLSATFSRNGAYAILFQAGESSEREEGRVSVLAMDSGLPVGASFMAQGSITSGLNGGQVAISDDGRWLASGLDYASFRILENQTRRSVLQLDAFRAAGIEFSPGHAPLRVSAVGLYQKGGAVVAVFEYSDTWRNIATLPGSAAEWVGSRLVIMQGATLDVWDGAVRTRLASLAQADNPPGQRVKPLDHARSLVGLSEGGRLRVIDVATQRVVFDRNTFEEIFDFELRGDRILVCFEQKDRSGHLHQYSLTQGSLLRSDDLGQLSKMNRGNVFVYGSHDQDVLLMAPALLPGGRYLDKVRDETEHTIVEIAQ